MLAQTCTHITRIFFNGQRSPTHHLLLIGVLGFVLPPPYFGALCSGYIVVGNLIHLALRAHAVAAPCCHGAANPRREVPRAGPLCQRDPNRQKKGLEKSSIPQVGNDARELNWISSVRASACRYVSNKASGMAPAVPWV